VSLTLLITVTFLCCRIVQCFSVVSTCSAYQTTYPPPALHCNVLFCTSLSIRYICNSHFCISKYLLFDHTEGGSFKGGTDICSPLIRGSELVGDNIEWGGADLLMVTGETLLFTRHLSYPLLLSSALFNNVCTHCRRRAAEPTGTQGCHGPTCAHGSRGSYRTCWLDCAASVPLQTGCNCNLPYRYDVFDVTAIHRFFICIVNHENSNHENSK
jgi:hypothetical protein